MPLKARESAFRYTLLILMQSTESVLVYGPGDPPGSHASSEVRAACMCPLVDSWFVVESKRARFPSPLCMPSALDGYDGPLFERSADQS